MPTCKALESWSAGVLGLKAEINLIFSHLPLVMGDPKMVFIYPIFQPFITPLLHHSNTPDTINLLLWQRGHGCRLPTAVIFTLPRS
jgi:hypothetical protein